MSQVWECHRCLTIYETPGHTRFEHEVWGRVLCIDEASCRWRALSPITLLKKLLIELLKPEILWKLSTLGLVLLALGLFIGKALAAESHISSLPSDPLTATELALVQSIEGKEILVVFVVIDGTGLSLASQARIEQAILKGKILSSHTTLLHLITVIDDESATGWQRAIDGSPRWVADLAIETPIFQKLKGHSRVGAQKSRLKVKGRWSTFRTTSTCRLFWTLDVCRKTTPPVSFAGVAP